MSEKQKDQYFFHLASFDKDKDSYRRAVKQLELYEQQIPEIAQIPNQRLLIPVPLLHTLPASLPTKFREKARNNLIDLVSNSQAAIESNLGNFADLLKSFEFLMSQRLDRTVYPIQITYVLGHLFKRLDAKIVSFASASGSERDHYEELFHTKSAVYGGQTLAEQLQNTALQATALADNAFIPHDQYTQGADPIELMKGRIVTHRGYSDVEIEMFHRLLMKGMPHIHYAETLARTMNNRRESLFVAHVGTMKGIHDLQVAHEVGEEMIVSSLEKAIITQNDELVAALSEQVKTMVGKDLRTLDEISDWRKSREEKRRNFWPSLIQGKERELEPEINFEVDLEGLEEVENKEPVSLGVEEVLVDTELNTITIQPSKVEPLTANTEKKQDEPMRLQKEYITATDPKLAKNLEAKPVEQWKELKQFLRREVFSRERKLKLEVSIRTTVFPEQVEDFLNTIDSDTVQEYNLEGFLKLFSQREVQEALSDFDMLASFLYQAGKKFAEYPDFVSFGTTLQKIADSIVLMTETNNVVLIRSLAAEITAPSYIVKLIDKIVMTIENSLKNN